MRKPRINARIAVSETLPARFYTDPATFEQSKELIFARSWQSIGHRSDLGSSNSALPFTLLPGCLNEPLVLTIDDHENIRCLSNVCTHRAHAVVLHAGPVKRLRCGYHGRQFGLDGCFHSMPEFQEAENFPRPADSLAELPVATWRNFLFTSIDATEPFDSITRILDERVGFFPVDQFRFSPGRSQDFLVHAHWALYCDNYLEGFHIPFVHAGLNAVLDYGSYETILFDRASLQIGIADGATECFDLPVGHPDSGKRVAAYYFWIFPNLMLNFYPWGLSVNIVRPTSHDRCRVSFLSYVYDENLITDSAGADLDKVEREDEAVVESVMRGMSSRFYHTGRFSPTREQGVHHFHRLIAAAMGLEHE